MNAARMRVFIAFAKNLATLSKCKDRQVAAVITDKNLTQVYSIGINGGPKGSVDCLCGMVGKYTCIHAEANALAKCKTHDDEKVIFCTLSPCVTCASLIINNGFHAAVIMERYHDKTGTLMMQSAGIKIIYEEEIE